MKKWIIFSVLFVLVVVGLLTNVYFKSVDPVNAAEKKAVALANKEISLKEIEDFHIYNGIETVNVIEGKSMKGEKIIVWIPEKVSKFS